MDCRVDFDFTEEITDEYFDFAEGESTPKPYLSIERKASYLYDVTFQTIPADVGIGDTPAGGCSSFVRDGRLYRNLDWNYDNNATFHVTCRGFEGLAFLSGLTDTHLDDTLISQLPYHICDGRNENDIMISTHVLYNDWEWHGAGNIPLTKVPFLILSTLDSMDNIEIKLSNILADLKTVPGLDSNEYLLQFLVTDGETTYIIAPPQSETGSYVCINATNNPKLTNFRWVEDAEVERADLQLRPTGVERWNTIPCELSELRFTEAYESPNRLSEFIGLRSTTKDSTDAELEAIYEVAHSLYQDRKRDGKTWHTMHSVVYSSNRIEELYIQEDWAHNFISGGSGGGASSWAELTGKPFRTVGDGLKVESGALKVDSDNLGFVAEYQGEEYAGKVMKVNDDGYLEPQYAYTEVANDAGGNTLIL